MQGREKRLFLGEGVGGEVSALGGGGGGGSRLSASHSRWEGSEGRAGQGELAVSRGRC